MKKFAISLIALAAISTASFASGNRNYDLRDSDAYMGQSAIQIMSKTTTNDALAVMNSDRGATNFERLLWISQQNDQGGRH